MCKYSHAKSRLRKEKSTQRRAPKCLQEKKKVIKEANSISTKYWGHKLHLRRFS